MPRLRSLAAIVTALVVPLGAAGLIIGRGVPGRGRAVQVAAATLRRLGFEPVGEASAALEGDRLLAWALDRSARNRRKSTAWSEGGAVRWRVTFAGGGEAVVATDGTALAASRPLPTATGEDLFPAVAQPLLEAALATIVTDRREWTAIRRQSWHEDDHVWHRARFRGGSGPLPPGWRREIEIEMAGSTVVSFRRRVTPLGTDMGVVSGRVRELALLRVPALVGLAVLVLAVLVRVAEGWAYHHRLAPAAGVGSGLLVVAAALAAGAPAALVPLFGLVVATVVTAWALWEPPATPIPRWGGVAGVALAAVILQAPSTVTSLGGWIPAGPPVSPQTSVLHLVSVALVPALIEEPLLRGALPGLLRPIVGWWGGALAGGALGALLHTTPAVPLVATFGVGLVLQGGLIVLARGFGVTAAVLARFVCELILRRLSYPVGMPWDGVVLAAVLVAALYLAWPRRQK